MKKWKKYYKSIYKKVFTQNAKLFSKYQYSYTGSVILFWTIAYRKKIPDDLDVALNRNNKGLNELLDFYETLKNNKHTKNLSIKTVFKHTYKINKQSIQVKKYEQINPKNIDKKLFEILLESGNLRISYDIFWITTELFPEKNGNGLTNLWVMNKTIQYITIKNKSKKLQIPMLSYNAIAQWYAMNFLKEIVWNNIYRFTELNSKAKDWMRLFSIISLLEKQKEDASPKWTLNFIKNTVNEYKKIQKKHRSKYIDSAITEFPRIYKMMNEIIKEYYNIVKKQNSKKYTFTNFYKKLWNYKKELNQYIGYLQNDMLTMLKKDILWEKYIIYDIVKNFSKQSTVCSGKEIKQITKNLSKINKQIKNVWIKGRNESFAYFYEMYMLKNLYIAPITKIL